MLSSEEHPGLFTFMVGLIVLVMAAVGLSLLMDRRFQFSSGVSELRREVKLTDAEISELKNKNEDANLKLANYGTKLHTDSENHKQLSKQCEVAGRRQAELVKNRDELLSSVALLDGKFSEYRSEYRRKTWLAAVGENLGTLTLRSGRAYQQVVIRRVTDVGLEIHHADGIARVQGPELENKFQDRFQWDDEERRLRLKEESDHLDANSKDADGNGTEVVATQTSTAREQRKAKIAESSLKRNTLRQNVRNWKSKVNQLNSDQAEAASRAGYGSKSVPGSLETWDARAARLSAELVKARTALAMAKADLGAVSPRDTLLAPEEEF
jgi:chromosome segregation ATPase